MAFLSNQTWYCGSTKYSAVAAWAASTAYTAGQYVRQLATPTQGLERVFVCIVTGVSGSSEPTWVTTQGAKTTDNLATWQEVTGKAGVNGDLTNCSNWNAAKGNAISLGVVIQRISGASLQICTTAGTAGSGAEPSFSNTAGTTTTDNTVTWTSLGAAPASYSAPWARLSLGLAASPFAATGDTVYVSNNHAETSSSSLTYNANASIDIVCVSDAATPPTALAVTGSVTTTGSSSITLGATGIVCSFYGIVFNVGTGSGTALIDICNVGTNYYDHCTINLLTTIGGASRIRGGFVGAPNTFTEWRSGTITFNATDQAINAPTGHTYYIGGTIAATGSIPTTLVTTAPSPGTGSEFRIEDTDLSAITTTIFNGTLGSTGVYSVENCKIGSGVALVSGNTTLGGLIMKFHNADSGNTNYRYAYYRAGGSIISETSIVRNGGAYNGTTAFSFNVATNALATYKSPLVSEEMSQWNDVATVSKTATVELTTNTALNNNDVWLEVEYPSSTTSPLGATASSKLARLGTVASLTTSSATWAGTAQTFTYKLQVTFTPQQKGVIKGRIYIAKTSLASLYYDPIMTVV